MRVKRPLGGAGRGAPEAGFTLVEMVLSVVILGIVSAALVGIVFQFFRTTGETAARLGQSADQQFVSAYWKNDVGSTGNRVFDAAAADPVRQDPSIFVGPGAAGACSVPGTRLVSLQWTDYPVGVAAADAWAPVRVTVTYSTTTGSGGQVVMTRHRCVGGTLRSNVVARRLVASPAPAVTCRKVVAGAESADPGCAAGDAISQVSLQFTVRDLGSPRSEAYVATVTADRRQG